MTKNAIIFDLDGTLCDVEHRRRFVTTNPKNWDAFNAACRFDKPLPHVKYLFDILWKNSDADVKFFSGRSDDCLNDTMYWLKTELNLQHNEIDLRMRKSDDRRQDSIVKLEFLQQVWDEGYTVLFSVDDRSSVVDMWRSNGVPCFQCAPGNF